MAKKRNRQRDAGTALSSKDEPFLDKTIIILGAVLVVLIGILVVQVKDILLAYRDMTRDATTGSTADDHGSDYRGVARLRPQPGVHLEVASFVDRNEPFVCRHCLPGKGLDFWASDDNLLQTVEPDASIPVRVAQRSKKSTLFRRLVAPGCKNSAYDERMMPFSKFLQHYGSEDSEEHWYGAQIPILSHLPQLLDPIRAIAPPGTILEAIGPDPPESHKPLSMYIGHGPLSTQTHYDSLENFVCVTSGGQKTFQLFDPATASLYMYIDREVDGNGAPVFDHDQSPTLQGQYPLSKYAIPTRVTLEPGDCLYAPVYWYHSVESSSDRTISINWWRMPTRSKMLDLEHLFCGHNESSALAARAKCN